jgi:hypothetical protein
MLSWEQFMGTALHPVFEKNIEGFDPSVEVSGKALTRHTELIDASCKTLGLRTLWDFYDESAEEVGDHLAEELSPELSEALSTEPLKWFDPADGIAVIQALRGHLARESDAAARDVIQDLDALERVLQRAVRENTRFRLALDM